MSDAAESPSEPISKEISNLATALVLAKPSADGGESEGGGTVFLIGAGCSVSAGIEPAAGVAKYCAKKLARKLSNGSLDTQDADVALNWLIEERRITLAPAKSPRPDGSHWAGLYSYFFEAHFQSANMQREIINAIVAQGGDKLNWAHACLGELVRLGYVHTVLTTNFDQLVLQGIIRTGLMPVTADGLEALNRIVGRPKRPQVVHLHGSMHTYDLRNSATSLAETSRHSTAQAMVHTLMKECDLLVVVGYSGGEEGIMTLLQDAGRVMQKLVIYWVTFTPGSESLSENAHELLLGENKFLVWGGPADRFFGQLMSEMKLGEPEWVRDPIKILNEQSERLKAPEEDLPEIQILVDAFKARVNYANRPEHRLDEQDGRKVQAAAMRARGDFRAAYIILEEANRDQDVEAARLHALNALSLWEEQRESGLLDAALAELEGLVDRTEGEVRLENILSLGQALLTQSESAAQTDSGAAAAAAPLEKVEGVVEQALPDYPADRFLLGNARLNLLKAQALQSQGERKPTNVEALNGARAAYEFALIGLQAANDSGGLLIEAKAGLAAVYQVLGEETNDLEMLRDAVRRHREVAELSRRTDRPLEDAGPLLNLAGALIALAKGEVAAARVHPYQEARAVLDRLVTIHQRQGDDAAEQEARKLIAEIDVALRDLED